LQCAAYLAEVIKNTETANEVFQSCDLASSSKLDVSLPQSQATMSIINASLSNNSVLLHSADDHSDECISGISSVLTTRMSVEDQNQLCMIQREN